MCNMDADEFQARGKQLLDYVAEFTEGIRTRRPLALVEPGFLREKIAEKAPDTGESWDTVFADVERAIMPGLAHHHSPRYHAFYPLRTSYASILASILTDAFGIYPSTWEMSPAGTELEVVTLDWLAKMLALPPHFLSDSGGNGGGILMSSASESILMTLLAARSRAIQRYKASHPGSTEEDGVIISKMVAYCSEEAHSSVVKAGLLAVVKMRTLETDANCSLRGPTLQNAIVGDKVSGRLPIFVCATLGTTNSCAFDNVQELGSVCKDEGVWMHIDAAYAGNFFICPEYRPLMRGVEYTESFNVNPHKCLQVSVDCSALWVRDCSLMSGAFQVHPEYMKHSSNRMPEYRHWQIPLTRTCRSLKLWFVLRLYGVKQLQDQARKDVKLAKEFELCVRADDRFQVVGTVVLGLVCFRLIGTNDVNKRLLSAINEDGRICMVAALTKGDYYLRFVIGAACTTSEDVQFAWGVIQDITIRILATNQ